MPDPQGNPGEAAGQPGGQGSPVPESEANTAAKPFSTPNASGGSNDDLVPRGLANRLAEKLERREARIAELEAQVSSSPAPARNEVQVPPAAGAYSDQIESLNLEIAGLLETDPSKATPLIRKVARLEAESASSSLMQGFLKDQQSAAEQQNYEQGVERSWTKALAEFPELNDQNSELYQRAGQLWLNDPVLKDDPKGMYRAALEVDREIASRGGQQRSRPPSLEGGGMSPAPTGGEKTMDEKYSEVRHNMRKFGDKKGIEDFIQENFDSLLFKDQKSD